jgi:hypothetical protein
MDAVGSNGLNSQRVRLEVDAQEERDELGGMREEWPDQLNRDRQGGTGILPVLTAGDDWRHPRIWSMELQFHVNVGA